ncbi:hypothetical protein HEP89_18140 [Labrenzia sp. 5N]|uniref:hypothetical protein n=1 Tax=Labrenzia sp. 5N TaxID=2723402 RepID=UPI0014477A7D|nr:hypothetical protein [Labrenzia sp. 5N]NKX66047.1 hypothetical protein [Labrenzia sp. 5N]
MVLQNENHQPVVRNGAGEEFTLFSATNDPQSAKWWPDTSFLVHALSDGDFSTLRGAIQLMDDEHEPVFLTGPGSVTNELYARLEHLGYMRTTEKPLPEEMQGLVVERGLTDYGKEHIADFVIAQRIQMEELDGSRETLEDFCTKFDNLREHHTGFPLEALHTFRMFFSDPRYDFDLDQSSNYLFRLYKMFGIVEISDEGVARASRFGSMNVPFLFDLLLNERGATVRH